MLSDSERLRYLLNAYFGDYSDNPVLSAVSRAYLDLSRTQRGFQSDENREAIQYRRMNFMVERISEILANDFKSQTEFDEYHKKTTDDLIGKSQNGFTVGQAQKWINMSLKYCLVIDPEKCSKNSAFFHVPIDNIVLGKLEGFPAIGTWSRLTDYGRYLDFQNWFREKHPDKDPILSEFEIWRR